METLDPGPDHPVKYLVKLDGNKNRTAAFFLRKRSFCFLEFMD